MRRLSERATAADPVLSGVGTALSVTGLAVLGLFLFRSDLVSSAVTSEAIEVPVVPIALTLVGISLLMGGQRSGSLVWIARGALAVVVVGCGLAFVATGVEALDAMQASWRPFGEVEGHAPLSGLSYFAVWFGASSLALLLSTNEHRWLVALSQVIAVFVSVCVAGLLTGAALQFVGPGDPALATFVLGASIGLSAYYVSFVAVLATAGRGALGQDGVASDAARSLGVGLGLLPIVPLAGAALVFVQEAFVPWVAIPREAVFAAVGVTSFVLWSLLGARLMVKSESASHAAKREAKDAQTGSEQALSDLARATGDLAVSETKLIATQSALGQARDELVQGQTNFAEARKRHTEERDAIERSAAATERDLRAQLEQATADFEQELRALQDRCEQERARADQAVESLASETRRLEDGLNAMRTESQTKYESLQSRLSQERRQAQARLDEGRQTLERIVLTVGAPTALLDESGALIVANEEFQNAAGEPSGPGLPAFFTNADRDHVQNAIARAVVSNQPTTERVGDRRLDLEPVAGLGWIAKLTFEEGRVEPATIERHKRTVLAIVGERDGQGLFEHAAETNGISLTVVGLGGLGLELALRERPDFVVIGTHLPDGPAVEFVAAIRADARLAGVPIAVIAEPQEGIQSDRVRRAGVERIVPGPLDIKTLVELVGAGF